MIRVAAGMLAVFTAAPLLPEVLAVSFGHSERAWEYVLRGAETCALIVAIVWIAAPRCRNALERRAVFLSSSFGMFENGQRPACRLAFPLDRPVGLPDGQYLCDAAGLKTSGLALLLASACAFALALSDDPHHA